GEFVTQFLHNHADVCFFKAPGRIKHFALERTKRRKHGFARSTKSANCKSRRSHKGNDKDLGEIVNSRGSENRSKSQNSGKITFSTDGEIQSTRYTGAKA